MKLQAVLIIVASVVATLDRASLATEQDTQGRVTGTGHFESLKLPTDEHKVWLFRSHGGELVALRAPAETTVEIVGTSPSSFVNYDIASNTMTSKGGVTLRILKGAKTISITADQVSAEVGELAWSSIGKQEVDVNNAKQEAARPAKLLHLKSRGDFIAELKIPAAKIFEMWGDKAHYYSSGRAELNGNAVVRISGTGNSAVEVKADNLEVNPEP